MVGRILYVRGPGRRQTQHSPLSELELTQVSLYEPDGLPEWRLNWRLRRAEQALLRAGAWRVVLPEGFPYRDRLQILRPVDPLPLLRASAPLLVLSALAGRGISPARAWVALSAPRLCPELREAAERLCPHVRGLLIDVPGGERYANWLHSQFGLPVTPAAAGADVTVSFGPGGGRWGPTLALYGERPQLAGLTLAAPGLVLPADCAGQLLSLLWEQGRVSLDELRAVPAGATPALPPSPSSGSQADLPREAPPGSSRKPA